MNIAWIYILCCRPISSSDSTFLRQVLLTLVQCRQADHGKFVFGKSIMILAKLLTGMLFVKYFKCLICSFSAVDNYDVFLRNEVSFISHLTFSSSCWSMTSFLETKNPALKILLLSMHTFAAWSIWNVMTLGILWQLGEFNTLVQSMKET